eukprot:g2225.t1
MSRAHCGARRPSESLPRMSLSHEGEMSPLSKSHSSSAVHERDEREHVRERMLSGGQAYPSHQQKSA